MVNSRPVSGRETSVPGRAIETEKGLRPRKEMEMSAEETSSTADPNLARCLAPILLALRSRFRQQLRMRLLSESIVEVVRALAKELRASEIAEGERVYEEACSHGLDVVSILDPRYPRSLRSTQDPPLVLFARGPLRSPATREPPRMAIVGARAATAFGRELAEQVAYDLSLSGIEIVSGLARGIDGAAHRGALRAVRERRGTVSAEDAAIESEAPEIGAGIAVLGSGLEQLYPPEHAELAIEMLAHGGLLLSEYPPASVPRAWQFPERNRIVSGLADAVLVVEAKERSGALITARLALEQGRDVFAVPGSPGAPLSAGPNGLIRDGARLFTGLADLEPVFGMLKNAHTTRPPRERIDAGKRSAVELTPEEQSLIIELHPQIPREFDALVGALGLEPSELRALLVSLELSGLVTAAGGDSYLRNQIVDMP